MEFSERLKNLRKTLDLNQSEFGELFGLSYQVISDLERGTSNPSKTLIKFLNFQFGEDFGLDDKKTPDQILTKAYHLTNNEFELIKALRELDPMRRKGIYLSALIQLNEASAEKEIQKNERKKEALTQAIKVLSKAVGES